MRRRRLLTLALVAAVLPFLAQCGPSRKARSEEAAHALWVALLIYAADNDGFPPMQSAATMGKALDDHAAWGEQPPGKTESALIDPGCGQPFHPNPALSGQKLHALAGTTIAVYGPRERDDGKRLVTTLDGRVRWLTPAEWSAAKRAAGMP